MKSFGKKALQRVAFYFTLAGMLAFIVCAASPAMAADACKTPDGFLYTPPKTPTTPDKSKDGKGLGGTGINLATGKGMGGTGIDDGKGMGGTGISDGKGMGGTGIRLGGEMAIRGRITGFGSICVNGLRIAYTPSLKVLGGTTAADLKIGQIVSATASLSGGQLVARNIALERIIAGRIDRIDSARGTMTVAGERVIVSRTDPATKGLKPGGSVAISGFRDARGAVVATYIERQATKSEKIIPSRPAVGKAFSLQGYVHERARNGDIHIEGMRIAISRETRVSGGDIRNNDRVIVFGRPENGTLKADFVSIEHRDFTTGISSDNEARNSRPRKDETRSEDRGRHGGRDKEDGHDGKNSHEDDEHSGSGKNHEDREERSGRDDREDDSGRSEREDRSDSSDRIEHDERPDMDDRSGPGGGDFEKPEFEPPEIDDD